MNRHTSSHGHFRVLAAIVALNSVLAIAQSIQIQKIIVNDARPMIQVLDKLEAKYGWQMTYEDPPYESSNDLIDLTDADFRREHPGRQRLIPAGKVVEFNFNVPTGPSPPDREQVLTQLLAAI